ncbi:MAG: hypothetical protein IKD47_02290 [Clostridia bacterium]|nr:hypothetical protein [Clostridia bacterium]
MKKFIKKTLPCLLLASTTLFSTAACSSGGGNDADKNKAKLYVYSFTSGFGDEWLTSLIADYEEKMKDVEIDGKIGIDVEPTAEKSDVDGSQMAGRAESVYFLEQKDYYDLVAKNYIADITQAVTSVSPYDNKTLESKMFADQKAYFAREINGETHYYAFPHYFTSFGIVYDVELFDEKNYYFADGYSESAGLEYMFIQSADETKTAGPDGEKGTSDDGLPTTYEEFLWLCDYIATIGGDNPLIWSGEHRDSYLSHFINALATDYEGLEQMRLNYSFDGEAKNLGKIENGEFVKDAQTTIIDGANGAELARQAGKYYALDFYSDLYAKTYVNNAETAKTLFSSTYSHLTAQNDFLFKSGKRNAMLLDGSWWQMEATETFDYMSKGNEANSKQNRKLGWMPLPKHEDKVGEKSTMYDIMYPLCVMKNGLDPNGWEYKYALDFIQFANSDEQLAKFTKITGCTKSLNYTLTDAQYDSLSYFGKTFYDQYKKSDILFPYNNNLLFANNQLTFQSLAPDGHNSPLYKSQFLNCFIGAIEKREATAETYFTSMYKYFSEDLTIWKKVK